MMFLDGLIMWRGWNLCLPHKTLALRNPLIFNKTLSKLVYKKSDKELHKFHSALGLIE